MGTILVVLDANAKLNLFVTFEGQTTQPPILMNFGNKKDGTLELKLVLHNFTSVPSIRTLTDMFK